MTYTQGSVFGDALASFQRAALATAAAKSTLTSLQDVASAARTSQASAKSRADELIASANADVDATDEAVLDQGIEIQAALREEIVAVENLQRTAAARLAELSAMVVPELVPEDPPPAE